LTGGSTPSARPPAGRFVLVAAGVAFVALFGAYAWLWAPWRYFPADELARVAYPMRDVGLQYPPGVEGVDYYGTLRLNLYIDERGHVDRVEVVEATVPESFRASAVAAFGGTPFDPATRYGRPVKSMKKVEVKFAPPLRGLDSSNASR
jgi:TonB family protein